MDGIDSSDCFGKARQLQTNLCWLLRKEGVASIHYKVKNFVFVFFGVFVFLSILFACLIV